MQKNWFVLLFLTLLAACDGGGGDGGSSSASSSSSSSSSSSGLLYSSIFTDIAVHDPSVIHANDQYYVFGSHLSTARSSDLTNWTRVADGVNNANPLVTNVLTEFSEVLTWAQATTLWAPDVAYINGQYLMYYNACIGNAPLSAMGIASASTIEGPYTHQGVILRSGMAGESEDGTTYNAWVHPNVVDPAIYWDISDNLWMVYGSYSGGIFIMELDPATGFPLPGQGYGEHVWGGNHARIEGAYVIYNADTGYYYMFVSYGGLAAGDGYQIRVARSSNPNGPYFDAAGTDMKTVKGRDGIAFDDVAIAPHGVKLMGNYSFAGTGIAYVSPGHSSAFQKADTDQYFLFFHTRFPGRGEQHEVRVHEFFFNDDGWPVVAPLRYVERFDDDNPGATPEGLAAVSADNVPGTYQYVNHGKDISGTLRTSANIVLESGGGVSGAVTGSWTYTESTRAITLTLNSVNYQGMVSRQWNQNRDRFEATFTVLSADGTAVWGIKSS